MDFDDIWDARLAVLMGVRPYTALATAAGSYPHCLRCARCGQRWQSNDPEALCCSWLCWQEHVRDVYAELRASPLRRAMRWEYPVPPKVRR